MVLKWFKKEKSETPAAPEVPEPESGPAPEPAPGEETAPAAPDGTGAWFRRLRRGLTKTRDFLNTDIEDLFTGQAAVDEALLEDLEALLIMADIGAATAGSLVAAVRRQAGRISDAEGIKTALREEIRRRVTPPPETAAATPARPHVIMVVGVNGVGKTTTIGKLAAQATARGQRVVLAAADTFRAAAIEQLGIWAERAGAELVRHQANADPAAVAYDAVTAAVARQADLVLVDTAGRLHTNVNLMQELKKIRRTLAKPLPEAPHEVLLVMDATTGQNGLSQARQFHDALGVTGVALTKLDGTAKGGIVVAIAETLGLPLLHVGVGEQIDDLQPFDPEGFVRALL